MIRAVQLFTICLTTITFSQSSIKAVKTDVLPVIDGLVDEAVWESGCMITDFIQRVPDIGRPMTEKTVVYMLYSSHALFFGMKCYDSEPTKITAKELVRDASLGDEDKIQIIIDTFFDKRNAYWFQINPRGCIGDALVSQNGAAFNKSWDGLWEGKAHITDWGWEGEVAIPFKTVSFRRGQTTWGLKLIRQVTRKSEQGYWPVANLDSHKFQVSDAAELTGLYGVSQGIGLDVVPYALAGIDKQKATPHGIPSDFGFDAFYQITSGLKTALTVNTDFAQTEVDDRRVNLTRFPLFFEEKRDFFLDGSNYFNFAIDGEQDHPYQTSLIPFFSRRLGLDADGNPLPILGGIKLTGQAGGWNVGFLNIVEDRGHAASNAAVGRIAYHLGEQTSLGLIGTSRSAHAEPGNVVVGADAKLSTSRFLGNKNISLALFGLQSNSNDSTGSDLAYGLSFFYPNDFLWIVAGFHEIGDHFRADLGFVPRRDIRQIYFRGGVGPRPQKWGILQSISGIHFNRITDLQNQLITQETGVMPLHIEFLSGESIAFSFTHVYERLLQDFAIHPEHSIPVGDYTFRRYELEATTARRRPVYVAADIEAGGFFTGTRRTYGAETGWKIGVPFLLALEIEHNDITLNSGDFSTDVTRFNFNILFRPDVFLLNFLQYDNLSKKLGWQSRFVWILKPGQEIFLVWKSISTELSEISEHSARLKLKYTVRF